MSDVQAQTDPVRRRRGKIRTDAAAALPRAPRLLAVGDLVGVDPQTMNRARRCLDLLGDPGRRTVFEMIAGSPQKVTRDLMTVTAMSTPDILYRLRSLVRAGAAKRQPSHLYRLDPGAAKCIATYFDVLATAHRGDDTKAVRRGH